MKSALGMRYLKIGLILLISLLSSGESLLATHNRAGEITYRQISELTYEVTVTTFTYQLSLADRPELDIEWGDNTISKTPRVIKMSLPNFYQKNVYVSTHTFPGPGVYRIVVQDPNRNQGVQNIPNSVNVVFSIQTILIVNPGLGLNSTPILLNPPYDKAALGYVFVHNPAAFDPDGDSISYKLTVCTREDGKPIENYSFPPATNSFAVNAVTGDLVWDTPADTGIYNVAIEIEEWRSGIKIGIVTRDMQIEVFRTSNRPPVNHIPANMCVEVGDTINFLFRSTDIDLDSISNSSTSGIFGFTDCPATLTKVSAVPGESVSRFYWVPCHGSVRQQPYDIIFKSEDRNAELRLVDIDNMKIKILGPAPELISTAPQGKNIEVVWTGFNDNSIAGYNIYRREGASTFAPDSCTNGIPGSTGFVKVGFAAGHLTGSFTDTGNGLGLQNGIEYTYRVVSLYSNGTESKASNELTSALVSGLPVIKRVTVTATDATAGSVYLEWKKPDSLDTIPALGPYEYIISRAPGLTSAYTQTGNILTADLNDTTYTDTPLNTAATGYTYKIELFNNEPGNRFLIGEAAIASTLYLSADPGDRKVHLQVRRNVPWINTRYDIFRLNNLTLNFDSIGTSNQLVYTDTGLDNGVTYCYKVRSTGGYSDPGLPQGLINFSEEICIAPFDNEPPCPPAINVTSECDSLYNTVTWTVTSDNCNSDIEGFNIFYKPGFDGAFSLVHTINNSSLRSYKHYPGEIVAGCYAVSAFDGNGNESSKSLTICVDSCNFYEIPNVFTPNGDGFNDKLVAKTSGLVEEIKLQIFNRNGQMVFSTSEPRINWDGTYKGSIVSPGVYFYQCDVFERRITGIEVFHINGFIHVITEKGAKVQTPELKKK